MVRLTAVSAFITCFMFKFRFIITKGSGVIGVGVIKLCASIIREFCLCNSLHCRYCIRYACLAAACAVKGENIWSIWKMLHTCAIITYTYVYILYMTLCTPLIFIRWKNSNLLIAGPKRELWTLFYFNANVFYVLMYDTCTSMYICMLLCSFPSSCALLSSLSVKRVAH